MLKDCDLLWVDVTVMNSENEATGAPVQVNSEEATSVILRSKERAPTTGCQKEHNTEHPSDQWQVSTYPCVVLHSLLTLEGHTQVAYICLPLWNSHIMQN